MKRKINKKVMLAIGALGVTTAAIVCVSINRDKEDLLSTNTQIEQKIESQEAITQESISQEVQQTQINEVKENETIEETIEETQDFYIPRNWSIGTMEASTGENEYTKAISDVAIGKVAEFWTFECKKEAVEEMDVSFERAFVVAGEQQEDGGICGSLWYASKENAQLIAQNIVLEDAQTTYFTMGVHKDCYLLLDVVVDSGVKSYIWRYTDTEPELYLGGIDGKKEVSENGLICYSYAVDSSCVITQAEEEIEYEWTGSSTKPYFFQFSEVDKVRGVNTKVITEQQVQELAHGVEILNQMQEAVSQDGCMVQYLLRENDRLDVNIGIESQDKMDFQYMSFDTQSGTCVEQGNGFYLTQLSGDTAVSVFQKDFMGDDHILPISEDALPRHMKSYDSYEEQDIYEPEEAVLLQTLIEENIFGIEFEPQGELEQSLEGLIWNCSQQDAWFSLLQSWFDFYGEYASKEIACNLAVIGQTKGFELYAVHGPFEHMMVKTPDKKYVWIDYASTCNHGAQPMIGEADFDKDGKMELVITGLCAGHGTGVNVETMLMVDQNEKQDWVAYMISQEWYEKELASYVKTTHDENGMQLWIDGKAVGEPKDVEGDTSAYYYGGCQIFFTYEKNKLYLYSSLGIFSDSNYSGDYNDDNVVMELAYHGNGKWKTIQCESVE